MEPKRRIAAAVFVKQQIVTLQFHSRLYHEDGGIDSAFLLGMRQYLRSSAEC